MDHSAETAAATAGPPPSADAHDPLPESNWVWRRVFVFAVTSCFCFMIWRYGDRLADIAVVAVSQQENAVSTVRALLTLCKWLLAGLYMMILFYLLAPSAEQLTKMIQTARSLRSGVSFHSTAKAKGPEGTAETTTAAGVGAQPAPPPQPEPPKKFDITQE